MPTLSLSEIRRLGFLEPFGNSDSTSVNAGDRSGEAVTRYNIAMTHRTEGRLADAVVELKLVVELDRQMQHPDLESDTVLHQVTAEPNAAAGALDSGG